MNSVKNKKAPGAKTEQSLDPTWLYLKSVGKVPLLTKAEELQLAQQIDSIQSEICKIIFQNMTVLTSLSNLGRELFSEEVEVDETVRIPGNLEKGSKEYNKFLDGINESFDTIICEVENHGKESRKLQLAIHQEESSSKLESLRKKIQESRSLATEASQSLRLNNEQIEKLTTIYRQKSEGLDDLQTDLTNLTKLEHLRNRTKEKLVNANVRLVVSIAKKYRSSGMELIDLVQEGNTALLRAVDNFDWTKGYKFSTYATWWIKQGITRAIADKSNTIRIPSNMLELVRKVMKTYWTLMQETGREPSIEEISETSEIPVSKVQLAFSGNQKPISLDNYLDDAEKNTFGDILEDKNSAPPDLEIQKGHTRKILGGILDTLSPKERAILSMRFGLEDGQMKTLKETGEKHNISRERVRQIEAKAISKLKHPNRVKLLENLSMDLENQLDE